MIRGAVNRNSSESLAPFTIMDILAKHVARQVRPTSPPDARKKAPPKPPPGRAPAPPAGMLRITKTKTRAKAKADAKNAPKAERRAETQVIVETTALARRPADQSLALRDEDDEHADSLSEHAHAPATERAYSADLKDWEAYARRKGFPTPFFPVTPDQLRKYIAFMDRSGMSVSTIRRRCAAIARMHSNEDVVSPTRHRDVTKLLRGLSRKRGVAPTKKTALTPDIVLVALEHKPTVRDRALLLFGICSAMRRSEIVAVRWREVVEKSNGLEVKIASSKTDKEGRGATVGLLRIDELPQYCPVRALRAWKDAQRPKPEDRVFRCAGTPCPTW